MLYKLYNVYSVFSLASPTHMHAIPNITVLPVIGSCTGSHHVGIASVTLYSNGYFLGEPEFASCPHVFTRICASSGDRPKLFVMSLIPSHIVIAGHCA